MSGIVNKVARVQTELSPEHLPKLASLGERIGFLAQDRARKVAILQRLEITDKTLLRYIRNETEPTATDAVAMASATNVSLDWLLTGVVSANFDRSVEEVVWLPRLDVQASAGPGNIVALHGEMTTSEVGFRESWLRSLGVSSRNAQFIIADGDSMEPTIMNGDMLLVDRGIDRVMSNGIYVLVIGGAVLVKRLQILMDQSLWVISDNPKYEREMIKAPHVVDLRVEGRVRWFGRALA